MTCSIHMTCQPFGLSDGLWTWTSFLKSNSSKSITAPQSGPERITLCIVEVFFFKLQNKWMFEIHPPAPPYLWLWRISRQWVCFLYIWTFWRWFVWGLCILSAKPRATPWAPTSLLFVVFYCSSCLTVMRSHALIHLHTTRGRATPSGGRGLSWKSGPVRSGLTCFTVAGHWNRNSNSKTHLSDKLNVTYTSYNWYYIIFITYYFLFDF